MGRTLCSSDVIPKSLVIFGIAILGRAEPMVELMTRTEVHKTTSFFFVYAMYVVSKYITGQDETGQNGRAGGDQTIVHLTI